MAEGTSGVTSQSPPYALGNGQGKRQACATPQGTLPHACHCLRSTSHCMFCLLMISSMQGHYLQYTVFFLNTRFRIPVNMQAPGDFRGQAGAHLQGHGDLANCDPLFFLSTPLITIPKPPAPSFFFCYCPRILAPPSTSRGYLLFQR